MGYITSEGLKELNNYKYKPGGYTWLDGKMNYFWEGCVQLIPMWVAPNLITFVGWILVILSYANMLRYDYTFTKNIPSSAFFFAAFCIFTYMTLDAIDGKQARRTKTSSPLGQLFDHGCDSFSIAFFMLAICQATKLEKEEVFLLFIVRFHVNLGKSGLFLDCKLDIVQYRSAQDKSGAVRRDRSRVYLLFHPHFNRNFRSGYVADLLESVTRNTQKFYNQLPLNSRKNAVNQPWSSDRLFLFDSLVPNNSVLNCEHRFIIS